MRYLLLVLACATTAGAADPPIRFPSAPQVAPVLPPDTPAKLDPHTLYVIDSDTELVVLSSPRGVVKVTADVGPMRIKGKFVDGDGTYQTRMYPGKYLYTVEAVGAGLCELLVVPVGLKSESEVIRRLVEAGAAPMPPPRPDPQPQPQPQPAPVKEQSVCVVVVEETSARTPDVAKVLGDLAYWRGLTARGHKWRFYDKDAAESAQYRAVIPAVPGMLVMQTDGKKLWSGPLPKTTAEVSDILKKVGAK